MKKVTLLILILTNFSCRVHNYNNDMRKCINKNYIIIKKNIGFSKLEKPIVKNNFDIFTSIKQFETTLIGLNLLKDKSEKSYKSLIENKIEFFDKKKIIEIVKLKNPYMYSLHRYAVFTLVFYGSCPYDIVITKKGAIAYYPTKAVFEKIIIENGGCPTKNNLKELLKVTDFKDETSRLLLCNLVYKNWHCDILRTRN